MREAVPLNAMSAKRYADEIGKAVLKADKRLAVNAVDTAPGGDLGDTSATLTISTR